MIKVDIISGFLGAGKTTFIKELISKVFKDEKVVLIENEFGEIGIDSGFMKEAGIEVTEMNSGCICCTLVGDFAEAQQCHHGSGRQEGSDVHEKFRRVLQRSAGKCVYSSCQQNSDD